MTLKHLQQMQDETLTSSCFRGHIHFEAIYFLFRVLANIWLRPKQDFITESIQQIRLLLQGACPLIYQKIQQVRRKTVIATI